MRGCREVEVAENGTGNTGFARSASGHTLSLRPSVCTACALRVHCVGTACALRAYCVHTAHAEAGILTQEYLSPDWLHSEAAKPT